MAESEPDAGRRLLRARDGSRQARDQLLEAFRAYLLTIARKELDAHLRGACGASDLVQETFLAAHEHFDQFRGTTVDELRGWLRRILRNKLSNLRRRGANAAIVPPALSSPADSPGPDWTAALVAPGPSPSDVVSTTEETKAVHEILNRLPAKYRRVLLWRLEEKRSFEAIGLQLGVSANAAEKLFARAVHKVRRLRETPS